MVRPQFSRTHVPLPTSLYVPRPPPRLPQAELAKVDAQARRALLERKAAAQRREQEEAERRVQKAFQRHGHIVRALREAEWAPLRAALEAADVEARAFHEAQVKVVQQWPQHTPPPPTSPTLHILLTNSECI